MNGRGRQVEEGNNGERNRDVEYNENPAGGHRTEHSGAHADKQRGTHLQETAAKLFMHGENKQETNQLQKSMSTEINSKLLPFSTIVNRQSTFRKWYDEGI